MPAQGGVGRARLQRCNVQLGSATATKKSVRRGGSLSAALSRYRQPKSEWASGARRSLKFCEMQQHLTA
jgi:hypothetical protein